MKAQKFETFCPLFPGFYNTAYDYDREDMDIESYNEDNGTDLKYDDFEWDYAAYRLRTAKAFVNRLESELKPYIDVSFEFQALRSPKEYNFANDAIDVSVRVNLNKLIALVKARKSEAAEHFRELYTSCSGFISWHSNDVNDWLNKAYILEEPAHRIGALLNCLCHLELNVDDVNSGYWVDDQWVDFAPIKEAETA